MSSINPYDYIDYQTINGNRYDNKYNRFGKDQKQNFYELKASENKKVEIHEVNINDLVNDAILDRLQNVTLDGVRRKDDYIIKEPIDVKHSRNKSVVYRDNNIPRETNMNTREFNKRLDEIEKENKLIEKQRQSFIKNIPKLNAELPVDERRKAVKKQRKGKIPLELQFETPNQQFELQKTYRQLRKKENKKTINDEINEALKKQNQRIFDKSIKSIKQLRKTMKK